MNLSRKKSLLGVGDIKLLLLLLLLLLFIVLELEEPSTSIP